MAVRQRKYCIRLKKLGRLGKDVELFRLLASTSIRSGNLLDEDEEWLHIPVTKICCGGCSTVAPSRSGLCTTVGRAGATVLRCGWPGRDRESKRLKFSQTDITCMA